MTPLEMARAFFLETGRRGEFDAGGVQRTLDHLAEHHILIVSETGMIGGYVSPMWVTGEIIAQEMFWWGDASLMRKFEARARELGATAIQMQCLTDRVAKHYERRGYRKMTTGYLKEF